MRPSLHAAIARACAAGALALTLAVGPVATARADTLGDYLQDNAALEDLLSTRLSAEESLTRWIASERVAQDQLTNAETKLRALLMDRAEASQRAPALVQQAADSQASLAVLEEQRAALARQVEAMDVWLEGDAAAPMKNNFRAYQKAREALANAAAAASDASGAIAASQAEQQATVARLGRDNTEITFWQAQAEAFASQVGRARERALDLSGQLAVLQQKGDEIAARVRSNLEALRAAGFPVGVARITSGPDPIPEPVEWTAGTISYALPAGKTAAPLVAAPPMFTTRQDLLSSGALGDLTWQAPVKGVITTPFGDGTPYQAAHYAVDLGTRLYAPVVAAADGVVEYASLAAGDNRLASYGLTVTIRHNEHVTTLYAHLDDRANGLAVNVGDQITKGQVIGYVGLTGYSTGPHVHFEVRVDNQPVDPQLVVPL